MINYYISRLLLLCCLTLSVAPLASAQTWVINIPSADVVPEKKLYVEFDFYGHLTHFQNGGAHAYYARALYGVTKNVEVGANVVWSKSGTPNQPVSFQPAVKWQYYKNEKRGIVLSGGLNTYFNVTNRTGGDNFGQAYTSFSKKVSGKYGPRFTAGGYTLIHSQDPGNKSGAIFGYEQPIHSKVTWLNDWSTGNNRFGYASTGVNITPTSKTLVGASYSFGNQGRGNNGLFTWVGYTF